MKNLTYWDQDKWMRGQTLETVMEYLKSRDRVGRVVFRDGIGMVGTRDYNPNRIGLRVVDEIVVDFDYG